MDRKYGWNFLAATVLAAVLVLGLASTTPANAELSHGFKDHVLTIPVFEKLTVHVNPDGHGSDANFKVKIYIKLPLFGWVHLRTTDKDTWTHKFSKGTWIKLKAVNTARFDRWEGDETGSSHTITFQMTGDKEITAYFLWRLKVKVKDKNDGPISSCKVNLNPPNHNYNNGDQKFYRDNVGVTATPLNCPGYRFLYWRGDCSGSSCGVTMDGDKVIRAVYVKTYTLTTYVTDTDGNHLSESGVKPITLSPADNDGNGDGEDGDTFTYDERTNVQLAADSGIVVDGVHYQFDHWAGACSGPSCSVTMTSDMTVTAVYRAVTHTVTLHVRDPDDNSLPCQISSSPSDIHGHSTGGDGSTLTYIYDENEDVTLTASSCSGYRFDHWEYDTAASTSSHITLTMSRDYTVTAVYVKQVELSLDIASDDPGESISAALLQMTFSAPTSGTRYQIKTPTAPSNGNYGNGDSPLTMDAGTQVMAKPRSYSGYQFDHWTGDFSGTSDPLDFSLNSDKTLGAKYWKLVDLTTAVRDDLNTDPGATINLQFTKPAGAEQAPDPDGDYGDGGSITLYRGTQVSASPNGLSGYRFDHWTQTCSGTGACSFTMDGDKTLGALYWKLVDLDVQVKDELGASIGCTVHMDFTPPVGAQNSPPDPDGDYSDGDTVSDLYRGTTVSPSYHSCSGYRFDHWELDGSDWSGSSFTMDDDRTVRAVYWKQYTLAIKANPTTAGDTHTLHVGTYQIDRGKVVSLNPTAHAGYEFDHWELDGVDKGSGLTLTFTMDRNHEVVAHFREKEAPPPAPTVPVAAPVYEGCILPFEFPKDMKYRGMYDDLQFNQDLLSRLAGKAGPGEEKHVVVLGGPNAIPYPWEQYEVYFEGNVLRVKDQVYTAAYGEKDYGAILLDCDNMVVRVAGVNRFGTRAALMWLLNHPDEASGKLLIVVEWVDANYDHQVQDSEVKVVYEIP